MDMRFSTPVQCSDDAAEPQPSSQRGEADAFAELQVDAGTGRGRAFPKKPGPRKSPPGASLPGQAPPGNAPRDTIVISRGSGGKIEAEGLASVLQPGGTFQLGVEIDQEVFHFAPPGSKKPARRKNKYKLTESRAEPEIRHLDVISAGLAEDVFALGKRLGLADATVERIRLDHRVEGQHEVNYRILASWKQQAAPQATLHSLARALVEMGRGDLADELRKG